MTKKPALTGLSRAMTRARIADLDERDLMPLEEARRVVSKADAFERGRGRRRGGHIVLDSDVLWAALLSLEDAREFVGEARRLEWRDEPREESRLAPVERYRAAMLPWIARQVTRRGDFDPCPAMLPDCLLAVATRRAFEIVWRVRRLDGDTDAARRLLMEWLQRNARVGLPLLADRVHEGEARARKWLRHLAGGDPDQAWAMIRRKRDEALADEALAMVHVARELRESAVLSVLDMAAEREIEVNTTPWPLFDSVADHISVYHGLRLMAFRARRGVGWGILFERVTGASPDDAEVEVYRYGSAIKPGLCPTATRALPFEVVRETEGEVFEGVVVRGPAGKLTLSDDLAQRYGLRVRSFEGRSREEANYILRLRAYLSRYPDAFEGDPVEAAEALELDEPVDVIVDTDRFTHILGTDASDVSGRDKFWLAKPSDTRVFRSLSRAIVERDPTLFRPGKTNLEWR